MMPTIRVPWMRSLISGVLDGGDHKISLRRGGNWLSYYLDFAPASDDPSTIYIRKFVQNGDNWRYHRYAMQRMINAIADKLTL